MTGNEKDRPLPPGTVEVVGFFSIRELLGEGGMRAVPVSETETVGTVVGRLGIHPEILGLMLLNGCGAEVDTPVVPGDRLALYPDYVPYHKVYGTCII